MRITYIHQYFRTPQMSGGTRSYELARRLVLRGHEVQMVTAACESTDAGNGRPFQTLEAGIRVYWIPIPYSNKLSFRQRLSAFWQFAWRAAATARSLPADVVYASSTPLTVALPGVFVSKRLRVPLVFEVRDLWPDVPIAVGALKSPLTIAAARALERFAYRNSTSIVALSPGMKEGVVRQGVDPCRVTVIPNSCDFDLFDVSSQRGRLLRQKLAWLGDRPLVLYAGALGINNRVDYFVRLAASAIKLQPEICFLVMGDGGQRGSLRELACELGVWGNNFFMLPPVKKCEMPDFVSAADLSTSLCLDYPQTRANSANKFFDALAAGTPVAVNHGGWLADLIQTRQLGVVLDPQDVTAAARTLIEFLYDRSQVETAKQSAHRTGRELFDRDELADRLEDVLMQAVQGTPSAPETPVPRRAA